MIQNNTARTHFAEGGASLCFRAGLSILQIKQRGDWASNAVEQYIFIDEAMSAAAAHMMSSAVDQHWITVCIITSWWVTVLTHNDHSFSANHTGLGIDWSLLTDCCMFFLTTGLGVSSLQDKPQLARTIQVREAHQAVELFLIYIRMNWRFGGCSHVSQAILEVY